MNFICLVKCRQIPYLSVVVVVHNEKYVYIRVSVCVCGSVSEENYQEIRVSRTLLTGANELRL